MPPKPTKTSTANQTYTVQQACTALGIKSSNFYNLVNRGELETFKNGRRYVTADAIDRYQREQVRLERKRLQAKRARVSTPNNPMGSNLMGNATPNQPGTNQPSSQANQ
jgi:excisionase family DNA binding protein